MAIIKWTPLFPEMGDVMDHFFEDSWLPLNPREAAGFVPAMDVYQTKNEVVVETALPDIEPEKVDISIENDVLTIKGRTEKKSEVEEKNYYRKEVRSGSFYRRVALPTHVLGEKAKATYDKGMLKIEIPKAPESKPKTIKVKSKKN